MEQVILVDRNDHEIGLIGKMEAHEKGLLHRAFSVFVFNSQGEILMQQRADDKYHSPGLWTNTCCSHPRPGESVEHAASRRLREEMGMDCKLNRAFHFVYEVPFENGLTEHEFDHVLIGTTDEKPLLNGEEVMDWKYMSPTDLLDAIKADPQSFTEWFKIALPELCRHLQVAA